MVTTALYSMAAQQARPPMIADPRSYSVLSNMPLKKKRYARIAITLPVQDLAAADRLAAAHDRSRSWIIAEAIRGFAASTSATTSAAQHTNAAPPRSTAGIGPSRLAQLERDLSLTPEARVREAEETLRLTEGRAAPRPHRIVAFDRYQDFLDWKRREATT